MTKKRRAKKALPKPTKSEELLPQQTNTPNLRFEFLSPLQDSTRVWQSFLAEHSAWWERHRNGPIYFLPEPVVNQLAQATPPFSDHQRARKALIHEDDAVAEHAFREACQRDGADTIGFWDQKAIRFDLLGPSRTTSSVSAELIKKACWDTLLSPVAIQRELEQLGPRIDQVRRRLLGSVGFLTFNPQYQAEKETLRARWLALPDRPLLPIRANVHDQPAIPVLPGALSPRDRLSDEVGSFLDDLGRFQRKWQLMEMVTWDLPIPQGPLASMPLGVAVNLLGSDQLVSTSTAFYDPPSSEDEREARRNQQRQAAKRAGLSGTFPLAGLGGRGNDASAEEDAFRLWLMEKTVRIRYGSRHGLAARLVTAFGEILNCGQERVKQLRQISLPFLGAPEPA
jgi:hypothetical protein